MASRAIDLRHRSAWEATPHLSPLRHAPLSPSTAKSPFTTDATSIGAQIVYDPYGTTLTTAGTVPDVGYQSSWTDPISDRINMQARWYGPGRADFLSSDTYNVPNKYNYANDNPLTSTDPTGHLFCDDGACQHGNGGYGIGISIPTLSQQQVQQVADFLHRDVTTTGRALKYVGTGAYHLGQTLTSKVTGLFHHGGTTAAASAAGASWVAGYATGLASAVSYWTQLAASEYASSEWLRTHTGSANRPTPPPLPLPLPLPHALPLPLHLQLWPNRGCRQRRLPNPARPACATRRSISRPHQAHPGHNLAPRARRGQPPAHHRPARRRRLRSTPRIPAQRMHRNMR